MGLGEIATMKASNSYYNGMGLRGAGKAPPKWRTGFSGERHMITNKGYTYNFCGPGTNLKKRLPRGDVGINKLDEACKKHDIAYSKATSKKAVRKADKKLIKNIRKRKSTAAKVVRAAIKSKNVMEDIGLLPVSAFVDIKKNRGKKKNVREIVDPAKRLRSKFESKFIR